MVLFRILEMHVDETTVSIAEPIIESQRKKDLVWGLALFALTVDPTILISFVLLSAAGYFATNRRPPAKSLVRKALEKTLELIESAKPLPLPAPG